MGDEDLFCALASAGMADFVRQARSSVCFAGPGIQEVVAQAIVDARSATNAPFARESPRVILFDTK